MKQKIIFELEEGDNPQDYADPLRALTVISDICNYLRTLDKYGEREEVSIHEIRDHVRELCSGIGEEWTL